MQRRAKEDEVGRVETLGRWLSECPRPSGDVLSAESSLPLDGEMDRQLRYPSERFGIRGDDLADELRRSALRETFAVIPSDPISTELLPEIHDAGLDPAECRRFDLDGVGSAVTVPKAGVSFRASSWESWEESG